MKQGLYDAASEHVACGIGMVVNIRGDKTHELVDNALTVLENMCHRGAEGADGKLGDGAGLMFLPKNEVKRKRILESVRAMASGHAAAGSVDAYFNKTTK